MYAASVAVFPKIRIKMKKLKETDVTKSWTALMHPFLPILSFKAILILVSSRVSSYSHPSSSRKS